MAIPNSAEGIGIWIAALLTLFIFSFMYKDNPFYKFAEHLFVGVSAGYIVVQQFWQVLYPNLIQNLANPAAPRWLMYPVGLVLCLLLFTRFSAKTAWLSRYAIAVIIGVYAGAKTTGQAQAEVVEQVKATMVSLWIPGDPASSINHLILLVGVVTTLVFFFFSKEHKGAIGGAARLGIWYLMVSFGAAYGFTVMSRISLLIGRCQFLLDDWLGIVRF
ncbi:MAG: hypothetical protein ACREOU_10310 [Candidatus Eiseniibacteriota bacterium]